MIGNSELVIFDLDGTLADTIYDLAAAAEHMCMKHGEYKVEVSLAKRCIGNGLRLFLKRVYDFHGIAQDDFERELEEFKAYYFSHACEKTRLYDDTLLVLKELKRADRRMAVATMKPYKPAMEILDSFGIAEYFDGVIGGDIMDEPKPSPWCVYRFARQFEVRPENILVVGDGMTDVNMAISAGAHSAALLNGYGDIEQLSKSCAEYKLEALRQVIDILQEGDELC